MMGRFSAHRSADRKRSNSRWARARCSRNWAVTFLLSASTFATCQFRVRRNVRQRAYICRAVFSDRYRLPW